MCIRNSQLPGTTKGTKTEREFKAKLSKSPVVYSNIDALLRANEFADVMPCATSAAVAAARYRSIFSRNADAEAALLCFTAA